MKTPLVLLSLLLALPLRAEVDRAALVQLSASVLKIEVHRPQGGYALGSGVVIAPERIVTNCHVTQSGGPAWVLRGGVRWPVQAQASDSEHDLCVLRVPGLLARSVALGQAAGLRAGQSVTAVGYTGGLGIQTSGGEVVALHPHDGARVIQSSNWFTSGASGGGLFDDRMHLVGVLTFRLLGGEAHYFSAPAEWLQPLLDDESRYLPLADAAAPAGAYWQRTPAQQPTFLRAAALQSLERALAAAPDSAPAWLRLGLLLRSQGLPERLPEVRRALQRLDPALLRQLDDEAVAPAGRT